MATTSYTNCCRGKLIQVPGADRPILFGPNKGQMISTTNFVCSICRNLHSGRLVHIETRNKRGGGKTECGGACLNGKISCDCKCQGRCHGAGTCYCAKGGN